MGQEAMRRNVIRSRDIIGNDQGGCGLFADAAGAHGIGEDMSVEGQEGLSAFLAG